jgi:hypothetical protein
VPLSCETILTVYWLSKRKASEPATAGLRGYTVGVSLSCGPVCVCWQTDNAPQHLATSTSMQELLQQIDPDYYRSARLLLVHCELEELRHERSAIIDVKRRSNIPFGTPQSADKPVQPQYPGGHVQE